MYVIHDQYKGLRVCTLGKVFDLNKDISQADLKRLHDKKLKNLEGELMILKREKPKKTVIPDKED